MTDIERLITPISDSEPSGSYLKLDRSAYRTLRNSYNAAQSSFRQLVETPDASSDPALVETNFDNWASLREVAEETLSSKSKDLEILGWYITSQLFTSDPFKNLSNALPLLNSIVDTFWDTLNPMPPEAKIKATDEAGKAKEIAEFRTRPLLQLVGESRDSTSFYVPFQMIGLIGEITFGDYLQAERKGNLAELKENAQQSFEQATEETLHCLISSYAELEAAEKNIASRCQSVGATQISFNYIKTNVKDLINAIHYLVGEKFTFWPVDANFHLIEPNQTDTNDSSSPSSASNITNEVPQGEPAQSETNNTVPPAITATTSARATTATSPQESVTHVAVSSINGIVSRDHAFQEIRKIADYFKETEPHSPISFLLERSIRWGYMSFPELLQEMIGAEKNVIDQINQMTGMDQQDKTDLSGKSVPQITQAQANTSAPVTLSQEPSEQTPVQESVNNENDTTQSTKLTSNESSSSLQDFQW